MNQNHAHDPYYIPDYRTDRGDFEPISTALTYDSFRTPSGRRPA